MLTDEFFFLFVLLKKYHDYTVMKNISDIKSF